MREFWTPNTVDESSLPEFAAHAYQKVLPYVEDFLCAAHPYRKGAVCPFVPSALKKERVYFTYLHEQNIRKCKTALKSCIQFYLGKKQEKVIFGSLIILFPEDYPIETLLRLHLKYKPLFINRGLMLGALYPTNQAQSLHASDYFPLRTPTPTLVIRDLVANDLVFMDPRHYELKTRINFLSSFINTIGLHTHTSPVKDKLDEAISLKRFYLKKLRMRRILHIILCLSLAGLLCGIYGILM